MEHFFKQDCHECDNIQKLHHSHHEHCIEHAVKIDNADDVHHANNVVSVDNIKDACNVAHSNTVINSAYTIVECSLSDKLSKLGDTAVKSSGIVDGVMKGVVSDYNGCGDESYELYENTVKSDSKRAVQSGAVKTAIDTAISNVSKIINDEIDGVNAKINDTNNSISNLNTKIDNLKSKIIVFNGTKSCLQINNIASIAIGDTYRVTDNGTITIGNVNVTRGDIIRYNGSVWELIVDIDTPMFIQEFDAFDFSLLSAAMNKGIPCLIKKENVGTAQSGSGYDLYHVDMATIQGNPVFTFHSINITSDDKIEDCTYWVYSTSNTPDGWKKRINKSFDIALINDKIKLLNNKVYVFKGVRTSTQINNITQSSLTIGDYYRLSNSGVITKGGIDVNSGDLVRWNGSIWELIVDIDASIFIQDFDSIDVTLIAKAIDKNIPCFVKKESSIYDGSYSGYDLYSVINTTLQGNPSFLFHAIEMTSDGIIEDNLYYIDRFDVSASSWTKQTNKIVNTNRMLTYYIDFNDNDYDKLLTEYKLGKELFVKKLISANQYAYYRISATIKNDGGIEFTFFSLDCDSHNIGEQSHTHWVFNNEYKELGWRPFDRHEYTLVPIPDKSLGTQVLKCVDGSLQWVIE